MFSTTFHVISRKFELLFGQCTTILIHCVSLLNLRLEEYFLHLKSIKVKIKDKIYIGFYTSVTILCCCYESHKTSKEKMINFDAPCIRRFVRSTLRNSTIPISTTVHGSPKRNGNEGNVKYLYIWILYTIYKNFNL